MVWSLRHETTAAAQTHHPAQVQPRRGPLSPALPRPQIRPRRLPKRLATPAPALRRLGDWDISGGGQVQRQRRQTPVPLAELASESQELVNTLNAHTTRLTNTLTQLTDDILRSGSRLAYQVELLRGEALAFDEALHETLRKEVEKFVPGGLNPVEPATATATATAAAAPAPAPTEDRSEAADEDKAASGSGTGTGPDEPDFVKQLRTLTTVRAQLDAVIKVFGEAMDFVFPLPSSPEQQSTEEKGQLVLKSMRDQVSTLLVDEDPVHGIEKAAERVAELKELCTVWKGTAEESGRAKFIASLAKIVEDAHRDLLKELESSTKAAGEGREKAALPRIPEARSRSRTLVATD
ncbi:unnamed protein product [Parascedosporium putredinis]|uniref:Uncharacterized protein n=1 Tax=Parascedosporium putredinis TaxID=1442378 RepID=A0A9P1MET3_9PEZI|nr:unnamed protein product [Parascedosporium putredinis]CAI8001110.1 unnamed protein product [Parascedosporium putredinis]